MFTPVPPPTESDLRRFNAKVTVLDDGCHDFEGFRRSKEYPGFQIRDRTFRAHRVIYVWTYGDEPNADLHHKCGNAWCVNPEHLEPASAGQPRHRNVIPGLCANGHPFDRINSRGEQVCSICANETAKRYNDRNREQVNAKKRQRRRDRGEIVHHEPRACDNCGTIYTPKHKGAQRGKYCIDPGKEDMVAYKAYRDCINDRQRRNRQGRERSKGDRGVGS